MIPATVLLLATLTPILALVMLALGFTIVRQRRQIRELACEARHDQLTGLPNRRALAAHWPTMPAGSDILLVDLVGFKGVNDSFGHIVGDALLREVAARLAAAVPPPGLSVRWGGDEFIAAVPPGRAGIQLELFEQALAMAFDLSAGGGPRNVHIGARTGQSSGEPTLEAAIRSSASRLMHGRAADQAD